MRLPLHVIRRDGGTQSRAHLDLTTLSAYQDKWRSNVAFPPVVVFYDGKDYWLADGFHRHESATSAGVAELECDVRQGDRRAALLFSVGANDQHGLPRTREDKRRAVQALLDDKEWSQWSDRKIAEACRVGYTLVADMRKSLPAAGSEKPESERRYVTKHGTESIMKTDKIGRSGTSVVRREDDASATASAATVAPEPERRGRGRPMTRAADHETVRLLTEQGFTVSDIVAQTKLGKNFIHHARSLIAPKKSVLAGAIEDVEVFAESWAGRAQSLPTAWADASPEELAILIKALDACRAAVAKAIHRLKKEAAQGDTQS